jgi:predicted MFS family arabinose efflux permease
VAILRPTPRQEGVRIDYLGAITLGVGVLSGLLLVTRFAGVARDDGPAAAVSDPVTLGLLVATVTGIALFIRVESRTAEPMLALHYFRRRNFTAPMVSSAATQFAYMGGFVVIPILLDDVYGWAVAAIAFGMVPRPAAFSISSPVGGYLATRYGDRPPIVAGAGAMVIAMTCFGLASQAGRFWLIVVGLILSGLSAGISQPGVMSMVAGAVDPKDLGIANGMGQQMMFIGMVSGIQVMLVMLGENPDDAAFVRTFVIGVAVALVGLAAGAATHNNRDRAVSSHH